MAVAEEDAESQAHKGGPVRVNFEIDQAAHAKLKANAAKQGKTIRALLTAYAKKACWRIKKSVAGLSIAQPATVANT
ncbi:hypothetical protein ACFS3C_08285 [Azotobacter vinelandii]